MRSLRARAVLALVVGLVLVGVTVWLALSAVQTADYPPLQIGDRTVAGSYRLTEVHGDLVGAATVCAIAAVAALAWCVSSFRRDSSLRAASRR
ncbi:hypothetical protein ACXVUM_03810 [Williamsia sp. SKLECPSW1]